ncbi:MAG: phage baseplate assembly protein V [Rhodospirillum sp.]|nr:phage baseplate assembly protein V [Rhodospirillum sp.]MCF8500174.1 phage baseplate assembly protein V [Rhodospirillum sp.]
MMTGLNQAIAAGTVNLKRRMATMVRLARLTRADPARQTQTLQVEVFAGELHDNVKHVEPYGFTSHPLPDSEAVLVFPGGVNSNPVALVVGGRAYRLQGLKGGEVAIYDDLGQKIVIERDRILIKTDRPDGLKVEAPKVVVESPDISLGGEGGPRVARVGDMVNVQYGSSAGLHPIVEGSDKVTAT